MQFPRRKARCQRGQGLVHSLILYRIGTVLQASAGMLSGKWKTGFMTISAQTKTKLIGEYRRSEQDSGSPEVQVAILTQRITSLTDHLRSHKHDYSSRRGLLMMVSKRNSLLRYLSQTDRARYTDLIGRLGLRK